MSDTARLADLDHRHLWHPFTPMRDWLAEEPLIVERAEGCWLVDTEGRRYLDGVSSLWVNVHGHRHPRIDAAIRAQLDRVAHSTLLGLAGAPAAELAARLVAVAPPGLTRVFYSDDGSTAVEVALKMAFQCQQQRGRSGRTRFLALENAYHGDTLGAVAAGGIDVFHAIFHPLLFHVDRVPAPHPWRTGEAPEACVRRCLAALEATLAARADELAALIVEPLVQGAAGIIVHPPGFLRGAAELCRAHGVLLIADEVATGFGRTGALFACEHEGVTPDLLCVAKGLSGGYLPLAATLATEAVFAAFLGDRAERRTFFHGHSYTGNALACAAGIASLDVFAEERTLERVRARAAYLAARLAERVAPLAAVGEVRQRGLMVGIELVADRASRAPLPSERATGAAACRAARRHGVVLRPLGDVIVLLPPLAVSEAELDLLVDAAAAGIREVTE